VRRGCIGATLAISGVAGYAGLVTRNDARSPLVPIGLLWHAVAGVGSYALAMLVIAGGSVQLAESFARRPLVRPYLFALAFALWAALEAGLRIFFGWLSGGMAGSLVSVPLERLPGPIARISLVALVSALGLALAGLGPREAGRIAVSALRRLVGRARAFIRPAMTDERQLTASIRSRRLARKASPGQEQADPPAALLLPTAGFPQLAMAAAAWELPPPDLFDAPAQPTPPPPGLAESAAARAEQALAQVGVHVEVRHEDIAIGPAVIQLGIRPAERPRRDARGYVLVSHGGQPLIERTPVGDILRAQRTLADGLGVRHLRVVAPAPGQPFVACELPRPDARRVSLYEVMLSDAYRRAAATLGLPLALGHDIRGAAQALDLASAPHLLLAGTRDSSVRATLPALVASLLAGATPDDVRLLLLDSNEATLAPFDDVPHLLMPVQMTPRASSSALRRLAEEAERRAQIFTRLGVSEFVAYRHLAAQDGRLEWLPTLVMVAAELRDLLASGPRAEPLLCHLARVGRTFGIHLVLATERPEPTTLSAALKAVLPARLAFAVATPAQSRAILDLPGAECLAGGGDALLRSGDAGRLARLRATTIAMEEMARLARFWCRQARGTNRGTHVPVYEPQRLRVHHARTPYEPWETRIPTANAVGESIEVESRPVGRSRLPPLRRASLPLMLAGSGGPAAHREPYPSRVDSTALWRNPLPEGWTHEMLEDMMQQIHSVIAQGRAPRLPTRAVELGQEEE
jgi:hypothetical protein